LDVGEQDRDRVVEIDVVITYLLQRSLLLNLDDHLRELEEIDGKVSTDLSKA